MFRRKETKPYTPIETGESATSDELNSRSSRRHQAPWLVYLKQALQALALLAVGFTIGNRKAYQDCPRFSPAKENSDDSSIRGAQQEQETRFVTENMNKMHAMDWKIPADIQEERHKECRGRKTSSTGGFCLTETTHIGGNWMVDKPLAEYLRDNVFNGMNVVDLGAGLGHYGKIFTEMGSPVKSWIGYDGAMNVQSATNGFVRFMDLTQPHPADERACVKGDWVLSLEVAEHIPPEFTDHFIRNLRCSCTIGAVVSWAEPSQLGGLGHVNMKEQKDAIAVMARWGFVVDEEATQMAQKAASMGHFRRNTIIYRVVETA